MILEKKKLAQLRGDIFGGLTASVVALPVALAFGIASGMGPVAGLYTAIGLSFIGSIFGGTKTQISGPTGPMTVLVALVISHEIALSGSFEQALPAIMLTFFFAGFFQTTFGFLKLGKYINYIPQPVVSGFMSGIGIIIIILQLKDFFGIEGKYDVPQTLMNLGHFVEIANWSNVILAASTILIILGFPRLVKSVPGPLAALVLATPLAWLFNLQVPLIGAIPDLLPSPDLSVFSRVDMSTIQRILLPAFSLGALGMIDSLLTSVVADQLTHTKHNSNRELVGQGLGNMANSLVGGIPGSGTTVCTVANIESGATGRLGGVVHSLVLVFILLFATPLAAQIPKAVLSGILIMIGFNILDLNAIRHFKNLPKADNVIMIIVLVLTVFWSLLYAVIIGLVMAALYFMKKMADVVEIDSRDTKVDRLVEQLIQTFPNEETFRKEVFVQNLTGPIFFGFSSRFQESIEKLPTVKAVVFNLGGVPYMDESGLYTFVECIKLLKSRGINICFSEIRDKSLALLKGMKVIPQLIDERHIFPSVEECVMWLNEPGHIANGFIDEDELYIPSAFTPNGDGINDDWVIRNIDKYPNCNLRVFTREGVVIFSSDGYKKPWDGSLNGHMAPSDTYYYELNLTDDDVREGTISVFR